MFLLIQIGLNNLTKIDEHFTEDIIMEVLSLFTPLIAKIIPIEEITIGAVILDTKIEK